MKFQYLLNQCINYGSLMKERASSVKDYLGKFVKKQIKEFDLQILIDSFNFFSIGISREGVRRNKRSVYHTCFRNFSFSIMRSLK